MKKGNAFLVLVVLIGLTVVTWFGVIKSQAEDRAAYAEYMEQAISFEEKGIYVDALTNYKDALDLDPNNIDIALKVADLYYLLGDYSGFISASDNAISIDSSNPVPYINKAQYYMSKSQFTEAIKVVKAAKKTIGGNSEITELATELSTKCVEKYVSFNSISDWHVQGKTNYVAVEENNRWGMTLKDGSRKIRLVYDYLGAYDQESGVIPCSLENQYYYIDLNGNKKLVGDNQYQFLGSFGDGLAPAQRDNQFGYIDVQFNEHNFEFSYAGAFANGVAAVKRNGKWALIDTDFNYITGYDYDEILMDSNGYCSVWNFIVARQGDKYIFIDHEGKTVSRQSFDEAAILASNDSYIAVKQGDEWGFADQEGNIVIEPQYQNAKSFSMGLAPIELDDRWGYIDTEGSIVIETKYFDAGVFSEDGSAPVKNSYAWNFLVLCEYDD